MQSAIGHGGHLPEFCADEFDVITLFVLLHLENCCLLSVGLDGSNFISISKKKQNKSKQRSANDDASPKFRISRNFCVHSMSLWNFIIISILTDKCKHLIMELNEKKMCFNDFTQIIRTHFACKRINNLLNAMKMLSFLFEN